MGVDWSEGPSRSGGTFGLVLEQANSEVLSGGRRARLCSWLMDISFSLTACPSGRGVHTNPTGPDVQFRLNLHISPIRRLSLALPSAHWSWPDRRRGHRFAPAGSRCRKLHDGDRRTPGFKQSPRPGGKRGRARVSRHGCHYLGRRRERSRNAGRS